MRQVPSIVLAFLLPLFLVAVPGSPTDPYRYSKSVLVGFEVVHKGGICTGLAAFMTSDDFFDGLEARETEAGREFYKGQKQLSDFPDDLTVSVAARALDCSNALAAAPAGSASDKVASSLDIKLKWKQELKEQPIDAQAVKKYLAPTPPMQELEPYPRMWMYEISVKSKDVPLTQHLIVEVYSGDKFFARFAAHL